MKIAHEAPNFLLQTIRDLTDYDFVIANYISRSSKYRSHVLERPKDRVVYLDNGVFETGIAMDGDEYAQVIGLVDPDVFVVPDTLDDAEATIRSFKLWLEKYGAVEGRRMGVVQGEKQSDAIECYRFMREHADVIGISYNSAFYGSANADTNWHAMVEGRINFLRHLRAVGEIDETLSHHLLGCALPSELVHYKELSYINSIDTSHPVLSGLDGIRVRTH